MNSEEKMSTGIEGLDMMLEGGIPRNHAVLVLGFAGTGKTTLAMQFIWEGLRKGEPGIMVSLEESRESLLRTARGFGWDFERYLDSNRLAIVRMSLTDIKSSTAYVKSDIHKLIGDIKAQRVVVDPISLYESLFSSSDERRTYLFQLCSIIKSTGATALYVTETRNERETTSRDGMIEYAMDGIISLRYIEPSDFSSVVLAIRIIKMRNTAHSRDIKPYKI
ncbi:MAG: AAA family ATPase, partial [Theionarchaea archaeon]|nr:AAA family ATPase [Theionarchaea archaeon]